MSTFFRPGMRETRESNAEIGMQIYYVYRRLQ